jgi:DNA-binding response OmpR family regulator
VGQSAGVDRVLIVDDNVSFRTVARVLLEAGGFHVTGEAGTVSDAVRRAGATRPDVVLLDIGLPELDGWGTLDRIRQLTDVPIMMVTGQTSELEKVRALKAGADDYLTKPFGIQELLARTEVLLRRARPREELPANYGDDLVEIDFKSAEARAAGKPLKLTPLEFRLLTAFVKHPGQVLSTDQLLAMAWGDQGFARERVKIYVGYLRNKFRDAGEEAPIDTIRGFGYRYRPAQG